MKPLENYKLNNIKSTSKQKTNNSNNQTQNQKLNENKNLSNKVNIINQQNPLTSQTRNLNINSNINNQKSTNDQNKEILNPLITTPKPSQSNNLNITPPPQMNEREKEEFERTQKYINYLKEHLNSSYYANNEINNKNNILTEKSKSLNEEIKNNNIQYKNLLKSIAEKTKINNDFKKKYQNFLGGGKKMDTENEWNPQIGEKIKNLKQKNYILNKENQSKEEIILNLKKTF